MVRAASAAIAASGAAHANARLPPTASAATRAIHNANNGVAVSAFSSRIAMLSVDEPVSFISSRAEAIALAPYPCLSSDANAKSLRSISKRALRRPPRGNRWRLGTRKQGWRGPKATRRQPRGTAGEDAYAPLRAIFLRAGESARTPRCAQGRSRRPDAGSLAKWRLPRREGGAAKSFPRAGASRRRIGRWMREA